ncbi:hypothetical protein F443_01067 [Phytophthora nicotianae P1569]|uniref:DUF659 domain-containing protein n=1 Tax=Phytophthora nicotianae P1569 TaxID=1317065 RepID=V9FZA0_PHYNI|nr:hypothetical protein F443_01067 [Phytophthora nicotianae P1569]
MEGVIEEILASEWKIGAAVTDNAGQCGRDRRILAPKYPNIAFLIWFAHDINNLVKAVIKTVFKEISEDAAGAASFQHQNGCHFYSMRDQVEFDASMFCIALAGLRNSSELPNKLHVLGDAEFWSKLEAEEKIVRPLCKASFRLHRDENTEGDVVLSYMEIYSGFASSELSDTLTELVELRWNACEQPLFMLVFFLHPEYVVKARELPSTVLTGLDDVCQFAQY